MPHWRLIGQPWVAVLTVVWCLEVFLLLLILFGKHKLEIFFFVSVSHPTPCSSCLSAYILLIIGDQAGGPADLGWVTSYIEA